MKITSKKSILGLCTIGLLGTFAVLGYQKLSAQNLSSPLPPGAPLPHDIFITMAQSVNPVVVNISTTKSQQGQGFPYFGDPFFDFFFQPPPSYQRNPGEQRPHSLGTGFIIRSNGLIVTNAHVVRGADAIQVQLKGNPKHWPAKIVGKDASTDIALIKIEAKDPLPTARLGVSSRLQVGEWVAAFGNPYGHGHTMTKGIISAVNRELDELNLFPFLQTDAIINPGNSGGPLVNTQGEVIGVNTAKTQGAGIGFAIPIDNVKMILKDLETHGRVRRGHIGVVIQSVQGSAKGQSRSKGHSGAKRQTGAKGALIVDVLPDTPAQKAGIKKGDIITRFNKKKIASSHQLYKAVASAPIHQKIPLKLVRNGKIQELTITIVEKKDTVAQQSVGGPQSRKAPFNLGLAMVTGTKKAMSAMGLPPLSRSHPVVTAVKPGSPAAFAGFRKKDIILKVNGYQVLTARDVQRRLSKNRSNSLNILRYQAYSRRYVNMILQLRVR